MTAPGDRLLDLLASRATEGLTSAEEMELRRLVAEAEVELDHFELAAAAVALAEIEAEESLTSLPAELADKLRRQAHEHFAPPAPTPDSSRVTAPVTAIGGRRSRGSGRAWLAWAAAAACLALAVVGWWDDLRPTRAEPPATAETRPAVQPPAPSPTELLVRELAGADDAVELAWAPTEDPAGSGVGGAVVWSEDLQRGYMRFTGLPANDPAVEQYQLWIFDGGRDERYPVDGGVFDIPADGEAIVPIEAKLPVAAATLFAVTVERPGGVVVSSRERIVALAQPS